MARILVGTASWGIPKASAKAFPGAGSQLERYARVLPTAEINRCFYRPHRPATYARWAASTPDDFRFTLKLPRDISHADDFVAAAGEHLRPFAESSGELGEKFGCLLVQLPPGRAFSADYVRAAADLLGAAIRAPIAFEPRHPTWFDGEGDACLARHGFARVAADPPRGPRNDEAAGDRRLAYFRLHGSPHVYYSAYGPERLAPWYERAARAARAAEAVYFIFDNTAEGEATVDALATRQALDPPRGAGAVPAATKAAPARAGG